LIHWNADEAVERAERLGGMGYEVEHKPMDAKGIRELRDNPCDAVVIDLGRLPSQGRDMGLSLRKFKATRMVALVFVDGDPVKVEGVRKVLPDATFTTWEKIHIDLADALASPPKDPVVAESVFDVYKGTTLPKKLGIKANSVVAMLNAPGDFEKTLGDIPEGVTVRRQMRGKPDITLWFVKSQKEVVVRIERMGEFIGDGTLWIIWPKKASKVKSDLSQTVVRKIGLDSGLVDFKICSVDETWSGLCFTHRKK
jgi:hypothetical protein